MEQYQGVCIITRSVPNYTCIFLDFVHGFGSYVKGMPKTKRCNSVASTVSVSVYKNRITGWPHASYTSFDWLI